MRAHLSLRLVQPSAVSHEELARQDALEDAPLPYWADGPEVRRQIRNSRPRRVLFLDQTVAPTDSSQGRVEMRDLSIAEAIKRIASRRSTLTTGDWLDLKPMPGPEDERTWRRLVARALDGRLYVALVTLDMTASYDDWHAAAVERGRRRVFLSDETER